MKIIYFLLAFLCLAVSSKSHAQTTKGSFLLGGSLGFSQSTDEITYNFINEGDVSFEFKSTSLTLRPNVSYFVIDGLALGLITPFSYSSAKMGEQKISGITYAIGPVVRYYFLLGSQWAIFPEVSYSYGWNKKNSRDRYIYSGGGILAPGVREGNTKDFQGGVGLVYFLHPNIGLEGKFYYQSTRTTYDFLDPNQINTTNFNQSSLNFSVGLQVYWARKAE
ncbi:MAG TPA: autotransporter outer membrane beta-barrel domain-containing protein [Chryseolinea sp.]